MTHTDVQSTDTTLQEPVAGEVIVLQIDHVGSVAHLQDARATKRMRAIQPCIRYWQVSPSKPEKTWNICDVRVFSSPHWITYEDENVDICYRVTVRLRALSTGTFATGHNHEPEQDPSRLDDNLNDDDFEVTQKDLDAMQRPLRQEDWRRLEEAVDEVDETEDPDLRLPLVLYAPIIAPSTMDVDIEADMGFPEDYLGESDRVIRELDLANRHAVLSLFLAADPDPRRLRVELLESRKTHESQPLGAASSARTEIVNDEDWEKLEAAVDEWVRDARERGRPPAKAIVRNGRALVGRRTVKQPTGEFWMSEGARLVLTSLPVVV